MASESSSSSSFVSHNPFRRKSSTVTTSNNDAPAHADTRGATDPATSTPAPTSPPGHQLPSSSDFARALSSLPKTDAPPPPVSFARKKPVKKVRVQSPPPSSPESAGHEHTYPKYPLPPRDPDEDSSIASATDDGINGEREDPFQNEAPPLPQDALVGLGMPGAGMSDIGALGIHVQPQLQPYTGRGPPPNPFQKTLEDMERDVKEGGQGPADQASAAGKAGMDVEAFKRLLLTGQGPPPSQAGDAGSITETSSISRQSISDATHPPQETPRTSHEVSEPEVEEDKRSLISTSKPQRSGSRKKPPPPPPATRHGRLIRADKDKDANAAPALERRFSAGYQPASPTSPRPSSSGSPTDVNKPLPPPPDRADDDVKDSIFDKESAGKIPEVDMDPDAEAVPPPRPPTPPNASHSSSTPVPNPQTSTSALRKPAPPPRRQGSTHGRSESNAHVQPEEETTPPRSSLESQRSRSSSIRLSLSAPAPPPPRRHPSGGSGHRQSPSFSSPGYQNNLTSPAGPTSPGSSDDAGIAKLSPPPRPPQRNTSVRRGVGSSSARKGPGAAPPPPPPRLRGTSRGSVDGAATGPGLARTMSTDSVRRGGAAGDGGVVAVAPVAEERENEAEGVEAGASDEAMRAMLADLDALQREVDAARAAAGG